MTDQPSYERPIEFIIFFSEEKKESVVDDYQVLTDSCSVYRGHWSTRITEVTIVFSYEMRRQRLHQVDTRTLPTMLRM